MRILELANFTAGGCGVGARALQEAIMLKKKGHEVLVFSSNFVKGSKKIAHEMEIIDGVKVKRFSGKRIGGESFSSWSFESSALKFKPDVIIAHSYRHPHTLRALKIAKKLKAKVYLVTHAPFDRDSTRTFLQRKIVSFYDLFIGSHTLKKFDKIIAITKWEIPYLLNLGLKKDNIVNIPNGIKEYFFKKSNRKNKKENKILYMGRVSEIKNLEIVINALHYIKDKKIIFQIIGPCEDKYLQKLKEIAKKYKIENRVKINNTIYNYNEEIKELDSARFFILPSLSEGMPQVLVEAMARGNVVIASNNKGNCDLITDGKNGFLFKNNNFKDLAGKINKILIMKKEELTKVKKEAKKTSEQFSWNKIIEKIEKLIMEEDTKK